MSRIPEERTRSLPRHTVQVTFPSTMGQAAKIVLRERLDTSSAFSRSCNLAVNDGTYAFGTELHSAFQ